MMDKYFGHPIVMGNERNLSIASVDTGKQYDIFREAAEDDSCTSVICSYQERICEQLSARGIPARDLTYRLADRSFRAWKIKPVVVDGQTYEWVWTGHVPEATHIPVTDHFQ